MGRGEGQGVLKGLVTGAYTECSLDMVGAGRSTEQMVYGHKGWRRHRSKERGAEMEGVRTDNVVCGRKEASTSLVIPGDGSLFFKNKTSHKLLEMHPLNMVLSALAPH